MSGDGGRSATAGARDILAFFARFLACSIALYVLFYFFGERHYLRFIALLARPMLALFGHEIVMAQLRRIAEEISLNPLVFVSLAVAVARIPWRKKLRAILIGTAILIAANAATVTLAFVASYRESEGWWTGAELLSLTNNFFLPILLWLVLLPVRSAFPFFRRLDDSGA
jgi:hypothetical protein